jgi:hypothetical protein
MPVIQFKNFHTAARKSALKNFGLLPFGQDLSWIASFPDPPNREDLTAQITTGANQQYTINATSPDLVVLNWNGAWLEEGTGFTRSGSTVTMAFGYDPASGDKLVAYSWGASS